MNVELRRRLDRITDSLWAGGVTNPVTYIEQISYLIYLKLLDEEEANREAAERIRRASGHRLFPDQADRFRWSKWRFMSGSKLRDFLRDDVFPYMASLVREEPYVAEFFRDAVLEITDPAVLKQVIDELDAVPFLRLGPDIKGEIFEYLLTHLGQSSLNGQFRTPRQIRAFMTEMVNPDLGDTIYDPACGTGGFLIDAVEFILAKYSERSREVPIYGEDWLDQHEFTLPEARNQFPSLQLYRRGAGDRVPDWRLLEEAIYGSDVSRQMLRIASMNLVLHGVRRANLRRANVLSELSGLTESDLSRKYSVILSNPPFAGQVPRDSIRKDLPTASKKSELLFLGLVMESLTPGGRCAVVVPEGALFGNTGAHVELRRRLLEGYSLDAVISLPAGVFRPYAGVKTSVLFFRRPKAATDGMATKHTWFYDIRSDGYDPAKILGGGRPETPERNDIPEMMSLWSEYANGRFISPPGPHVNDPVVDDHITHWWARAEDIQGNNFNLTAQAYRPHAMAEPEASDPSALLAEIRNLEEQIQGVLEDLVDEVGGM